MRLAFIVLALPLAAAPTVAVTGGEIRGGDTSRGGAVFKGIPFAHAQRWQEPSPAQPWTGTRDATAFGPACAQNSGGRMLEGSQEDCLFLNVWTPEWPPKSPKPVMFWIHGGGNYAGSSSNPAFDGEALASHGVILVSANYRLTIFGFLAHPELTRESPHHASGNYGLLDQIAALKWVRANIAKFGGDPANVTVFGQSAGAVDASVLMTSPLARGLFQRVIAESGTVTRNPDAGTMLMTALGPLMPVKSGAVSYSDAPLLAEAEANGEKLGSLKRLRELPAADLLRITVEPRMSIGPANGIVVDGYVFPKPPAEVFAKGQEFKLPLLLGNNSRERTPPEPKPGELSKAMEAMYGPLAARAMALYGPPDPLYGTAAAQWVVDTMYRCPVVAQFVWHTSAGNPSYEYQFDRAPQHGGEVGYVFGTLGPNSSAADRELSAAMQQYWTNFAKTGDPNTGSLPRWPKFDAAARGYLEFTDKGPVAAEGLRRPFCDLYVENVKRLTR